MIAHRKLSHFPFDVVVWTMTLKINAAFEKLLRNQNFAKSEGKMKKCPHPLICSNQNKHIILNRVRFTQDMTASGSFIVSYEMPQ